ncbi:PRC-barrel domain-containing protein [Rhodoferax sp. U11-2br]|uniref:PRC-barrel domain-containing protein n=1 Tax=Rhodoferax sp. U11-2br TaxID=2838878 RepID=UPI001BEBCD54|nr:PRC-barrel domain-containing protein [Rhodoferax sp. U11-2br]MBT3067299.1 PRC-barrel domain-containing protein [Rhodoferax sp. U11-2br]
MKTPLSLLTLALVAAFAIHGPAIAQVAGGSTTTGISVVESTQVALGWSVKKTLLGKTIYNEADQKVGKVQDIIIAPDRSVSYIIVGAGGFIGMGRHDVAVPVTQIQDQSGKLVMAGASVDLIKAMPQFDYANDTARRDQFVAAAEKDITRGRAKLVALEKQAGAASADAKAKIDLNITALQLDVKSAEAKLSELNQAAANRWREFEIGVSDATARLRASIDRSRS